MKGHWEGWSACPNSTTQHSLHSVSVVEHFQVRGVVQCAACSPTHTLAGSEMSAIIASTSSVVPVKEPTYTRSTNSECAHRATNNQDVSAQQLEEAHVCVCECVPFREDTDEVLHPRPNPVAMHPSVSSLSRATSRYVDRCAFSGTSAVVKVGVVLRRKAGRLEDLGVVTPRRFAEEDRGNLMTSLEPS